MALKRRPYSLGESAQVRAPRGSVVVVDAPDGLQLRIPAVTGSVEVHLSQAGTWRYTIDGGSGTFEVLAADESQGPPIGVVEAG